MRVHNCSVDWLTVSGVEVCRSITVFDEVLVDFVANAVELRFCRGLFEVLKFSNFGLMVHLFVQSLWRANGSSA